jgi:hypothetical protein
MRPKKRLNLGAKVAVHRYCAPTVGSLGVVSQNACAEEKATHMDDISASEKAISVVPMPAKMLPYAMEAGPPLLRENWKVVAAPVQEACRTKEKLMAETRLMYR